VAVVGGRFLATAMATTQEVLQLRWGRRHHAYFMPNTPIC
jgi:hypothetical protein